MYKNINLSEISHLRRNLSRLENLYNLKKFLEKHDLNNLLQNHNKDIFFDALNRYECNDINELNCILSNTDILKVIEFMNKNYKELIKSNNTKNLLSLLDKYIAHNNMFKLNTLFNSLCEIFKISKSLKKELIHLTQGFTYQKRVYNDVDEEFVDEYFDSCPFGLDFIRTTEKLAAHFNVNCLGISKCELGTREFYTLDYDKYFQDDFEDIRDSLTFTDEGYVEPDSYFNAFETEDYILYIGKNISNKILDSLKAVTPNYSPYHQYIEFYPFKEDDGGVKIYFNDGAIFPGVPMIFLILLILMMAEEI